ncbi:hypothetical protein D3C86_1367600 [compost metagenome]
MARISLSSAFWLSSRLSWLRIRAWVLSAERAWALVLAAASSTKKLPARSVWVVAWGACTGPGTMRPQPLSWIEAAMAATSIVALKCFIGSHSFMRTAARRAATRQK